MFAAFEGKQYTGLAKNTTDARFEWTDVQNLAADVLPAVNSGATAQRIFVPLDFSFSSAYGLCLPIIGKL